MKIKEQFKKLWSNNLKVVENYFFMTSLQVVVILINIVLYPYLIRTLGKESYGTYIFILSNVQLFVLFFASGFSTPALKKIALHTNNLQIKSQTISEVFTAKFILFFLCALLLAVAYIFLPFVREHFWLYATILFTSSLGDALFPLWYFQGMQRMSFVTGINLCWRILSIPLILVFVKAPSDLFLYVIIISVLPFLGNLFTFLYLIIKENIKIRFVSFSDLKLVFQKAIPFYWTSAFSSLKTEGIKFFIGVFWDMNSVAIYDLANKIVSIADILTNSINTAIFPKVITNLNLNKIKQIFRYEAILGVLVSVLIAVFGYWAVLILGGRDMLAAYPLTVVLGFSTCFSLMVGCYVNYVFVPREYYYFITKKQIVSFFAFFIILFLGLMIYKNIIIIVLAFTLSSCIEMLFCRYLTKKHKLLY